jgi:hypothetical protein
VNGLRIGLPFFEPEKMAFANTKTFQVWVSVFAFVVWKGCDPKRLQSLGIESDGTLEVTDCENNVVYHIFPGISDLDSKLVYPNSPSSLDSIILDHSSPRRGFGRVAQA